FAPAVVIDTVDLPPAGGEFGPAPWQLVVPEFDLGAAVGDGCLTLNVWSPQHASGLPVVLWFYGGGFEGGAASIALFDGEALAASVPCVVVTANYRVGAYGFATLEHHGGRLRHANNLGLGDAMAAYQWVLRTIALFGGDPARVTVAGQSAGGFLSMALAVSPTVPAPSAVACFSGGASRIVSESVAREIGDALLAELELADDPEDIIDLPPAQVIAAQSRIIPTDLGVRNGPSPYAFGVALDGSAERPIVPRHPLDAVASGALLDTFVLSSATSLEAVGFDPSAVAAADSTGVAQEVMTFSSGADSALVAAYATDDPDPSSARARLLSDYIYRLPAARLVETQVTTGGRAALLEVAGGEDGPAGHGAELRALFGAVSTDADAQIARVFSHLISHGCTSRGTIADPIVVGASRDDRIIPLHRLVELWKGVPRP
ncbi:MAG: carboxylesterase family protein, partial [Microbacterium sp.]